MGSVFCGVGVPLSSSLITCCAPARAPALRSAAPSSLSSNLHTPRKTPERGVTHSFSFFFLFLLAGGLCKALVGPDCVPIGLCEKYPETVYRSFSKVCFWRCTRVPPR